MDLSKLLSKLKQRLINWLNEKFAFLDQDWQADFGDDEDDVEEERCSACCLSPHSQNPRDRKVVCIRCRQPISA